MKSYNLNNNIDLNSQLSLHVKIYTLLYICYWKASGTCQINGLWNLEDSIVSTICMSKGFVFHTNLTFPSLSISSVYIILYTHMAVKP